MAFVQHIHKYPFLRLLIPLVAGVICGDIAFPCQVEVIPAFLFLFIPVSVLFIFAAYRIKRYSLRWIFGAILCVFIFSFGMGNILLQLKDSSYSFPVNRMAYHGVITQKPEYKENSVLCKIELIGYCDSINYIPLKKNILLYFPLGNESDSLRSGDEVIFYSKISLPTQRGNPDEFDYKRYLIHRNVSGTAYVAAGQWEVIDHYKTYSFQKISLDFRDKIIGKYKELGFDKETFSVLSALTVGYKEELSEEIRESFSVSGASHILALSGLHIGFIYGFIALLLRFIPRRVKKFQLPRGIIIIVLLWLFAFVTGLSPSTVRSVIMFSVFVLSGLVSGKAFSFNSLCIAGFAMLIFRPGWLFDVGFQLSFCAVSAILIIRPWTEKRFHTGSGVLKYIWSLITVSVAAQIGTAPLVMFYFSRYSTHFLLTNLMVIPLVFVIIHIAVIMLLSTPFPAIQQVLADITRFLIKLLTGSVRYVERLPFSSFDDIRLYRVEVIGIYLFILLLTAFFFYRKPRFLISCVLVLLCTGVCGTVSSYNDRPKKSIVFYNVRNCPALHCIGVNKKSWLVYPDSLPQKERLGKSISGYGNRLRLSEPSHITGDHEEGDLLRINNIVWYGGKKIALINNNYWRMKRAKQLLHVDYLYICNGYKGNVSALTKNFSAGLVILDTSLPAYRKEKIINECIELNLEYASTDQGAIVVLV